MVKWISCVVIDRFVFKFCLYVFLYIKDFEDSVSGDFKIFLINVYWFKVLSE